MSDITFAEMPPVRSRRRGQVTVDGSDFVIRAPYDPEQLEAIRALPDRRWDNAGKVWRVGSRSATRVRALASHFGWDMDGEEPAAESLVKVDVRGSLLYVRFKYLPALALRVRNVPGAHYSAGEKAWAVPIESVESLHVALKDVRVDGPSFMELADRARAAMRLVAMSSAIDAEIEPIPGLHATLANFQRAAVAYALETRRTFISLRTGMGKTPAALASVEAAGAYPCAVVVPATLKPNWLREVGKFLPGRRAVVLAGIPKPQRARTLALVAQAHARARAGQQAEAHGTDGALALNGCDLCAGLAPEAAEIAHADLLIVNFDILRPDSETKTAGWVSVLAGLGLAGLIVDECFVGNTPVLTEFGWKSIAEVRAGWFVASVEDPVQDSALVWREVMSTFCRPTRNPLVRVKYEGGEFVCTTNHRIYLADGGIVCAGDLEVGAALRVVRRPDESEIAQSQPLLRSPLFRAMEGASISATHGREDSSHARRATGALAGTATSVIGAHDEAEPHEGPSRSRAGRKNAARDGAPAIDTRWQRDGTKPSGAGIVGPAGRMGLEPCCTNTAQVPVPASLQTRHLANRHVSRSGDRRELPQDTSWSGSRSPQGVVVERGRVVSVEVVESGSAPGSRRGSGDGAPLVYDLTVADTHRYFAGGALVSNSHAIKEPNAQRTKATIELSRSMPADAMRLALTATPVINQRIELASQLDMLGRLDEFGTAHAISAMTDINTRLRARAMYRIRHEDVGIELPCPRPQILVSGDPKAMVEYRKAEKDLLNYLAEKAARIAAANGLDPADAAVAAKMRAAAAEALVRITTCKRLAAKAKIPAAVDWVRSYLDDDPAAKLLVFAHHTDVLRDLAEPFDAPVLAGGMSGDEKMALVDRFQDDPACRVLVIGITAGGVGLTLTAARDVLFVEQAWSPATHLQASSRAFGRMNDLHGGSSFFLLCADTIDDQIATLLESKATEIDDATDGSDDPEGRTSVLADLVASLTTRGQR